MTACHLASGHQSGQATTARNMEFTSITMLEFGSTTCQILTSRAMTFARAVETTLILTVRIFAQSVMRSSLIKIKSGGETVKRYERLLYCTGSNPVLTTKN